MSQANPPCRICGVTENLSWCSKCHQVTYCSKEHQKEDWRTHKQTCKTEIENDVYNLHLTENYKKKSTTNTSSSALIMANADGGSAKPTQSLQWRTVNSVQLEKFSKDEVTENDRKMVSDVWKQMKQIGFCILNNFLPEEQAEDVHRDITALYEEPKNFVDGETVKQGSNLGPDRVRGDRIRWIEEDYKGCKALQLMCRKLDKLIQLCSKIGDCNIEERTKPMVACYPGDGACYKRHVDNPAGDGRCITCLYYINKNWKKEDGGYLCIYPKVGGERRTVVCEPFFNRICIFFSDGRNPHEVLPTYKKRFAVTCWYFDRDERKKAVEQWATRAKLMGGSQQT